MKVEMKELNRQEMEQVTGGASMEECVKWAIEKYGVNVTVEEVMNYMGDYKQYYEKYASPEQIQKFSEMFHQPEMFVKMGMGVKAIPLPDEMVEKPEKAVEKAPAKEPQKKEPTAKRRKTPDHNDR